MRYPHDFAFATLPTEYVTGAPPVVVFVTGGAWTIGYKAWGALLARRLSQRGLLVFCLDYRNFPQVLPLVLLLLVTS